jgi:hypothetical protein
MQPTESPTFSLVQPQRTAQQKGLWPVSVALGLIAVALICADKPYAFFHLLPSAWAKGMDAAGVGFLLYYLVRKLTSR